MAWESDKTGTENLPVAAAEDLRSYFGFGVNFSAAGVKRSVAAVESGAVFVVADRVNSGQQVAVWGAPNVAKAFAGLAVVMGNPVACQSGGSFVPTSWGGGNFVTGVAMDTVASGGIFTLRLV